MFCNVSIKVNSKVLLMILGVPRRDKDYKETGDGGQTHMM